MAEQAITSGRHTKEMSLRVDRRSRYLSTFVTVFLG